MASAELDRALRVAMVAGEASGDVLAGLLLTGLRQAGWALQAQGVGGSAMRAAGFEALASSDALAVRGYVEVLRHYRRLVALRDSLARRWLADRPDVFVGIDAPDFNLVLAQRLRSAGIKTVQFVCPSIWAWRAQRVQLIKAAVDHVLCLFPFEPELLRAHGIAASYVGHPLASVIPLQPDQATARQTLALDAGEPVLAILPGSRAAEIAHLLPRFLAAARLLRRRHPRLQLVLPAVAALRQRIAAVVESKAADLSVRILDGQAHAAMAAADVVLVASGTATLEVALSKRPMVIAYHMAPLSWWLHQRQRLQPWVGLPNILARQFLVPEFLQSAATPQALADALHDWLNAPQRVAALRAAFTQMHLELRQPTGELAAAALAQVCRV